MRLMEERAKKAASQARETGNIEDAAKAQELANQLQKAKEAEFRAAKFGDSSAGFARQSVNQIVGEIPAAKDFSITPKVKIPPLPDVTDLTIRPQVEIPPLPDVTDLTIRPQVEISPLPDVTDLTIRPQVEIPPLADATDLTITPKVKIPPLPDVVISAQLRDIPSSTGAQRTQPVRLENPPNLQGIEDKLDKLIANAGVFS
jgi:hypothetical protein